MKKFLIAIIIVISIMALPKIFVNAENSYYYVFHLYYDKSNIALDRDFKYGYDVIPGDYVQPEVQTSYPFSAKVINIKGSEMASIKFDPLALLKGKAVGKIDLSLPYFADAKEVQFYNATDKILINVSVADSSFCNDDNICDSDVGENYINCPLDCKGSSLVGVSASSSPAPIENQDTGNSLFGPIMYLVTGVVIILGYVSWRLYRKRKPNIPPLNN